MTSGEEEGKPLRKATINIFDTEYPDLSDISIRTIPKHYCIAEEKITINPPDKVYTMKMRYFYLFPNLINDADISKINPIFHWALYYGALKEAFAYREEEQREAWATNRFTSIIRWARKFVKDEKDLIIEFPTEKRESF
jgi:hypothetical protein